MVFPPTHYNRTMHIILWEFTVAAEKQQAFLQAYGPEGNWAQLFRRAEGYRGTELLQSEASNTYITIDRWDEASDFERFKERFATEYQQLDASFEKLDERKLGTFSLVRPENRP